MSGEFEGKVRAEWLEDGRTMRLLEPFAYTDPAGLKWQVPANAVIDGASIPKALWTVLDGPFEGKHRTASVVHDWYCSVRTRAWQDVHRMFYDAMLTSGVNVATAKIMYLGVRWGGPQWSEMDSQNTNLSASGNESFVENKSVRGTGFKNEAEARQTVRIRKDQKLLDFRALRKRAVAENLSLDEIDALTMLFPDDALERNLKPGEK